ncbi:MAG: TetR/AcrR family transcriptional regulator [Pseudomonadota bacterium]|nr:TetR/AcrR family transcriptional regulator [Pseudomonadota bacterium]
MAQIARESGVAVGQIYRDFAAKEDIVAAIVERDCARLRDRDSLHQAISAGDAAAVWTWIRHFFQPTQRSGSATLLAEIVAESARNERIAAIFAGAQNDARADMLAALALLAPGDQHANRRALLADLVLTQSLGLMQHRLLRPELADDLFVSMIGREIAFPHG